MPLPRVQLFELEDLSWFPPAIRDLATDYLQFMEARFHLHKPVIPLLREVIEQSGSARIVDLCSGGAGPVLALHESLLAAGISVPFTLTDKYPNLGAFHRVSSLHPAGISFIANSVNATEVPRDLIGLRTMFNAFHHFAPASARAVLRCAVEAGQPIAIFEVPERRLATMIPFLFTPLFVAIASPFIRPFQWRRLLWTYVAPVVPLTCWWDGLVSQWRAYTIAELLALTAGLASYSWKADRVPIGPTLGHLTYLIGLPRV